MRSLSYWSLEATGYKERGKPEYPKKTSRRKRGNLQRIHPMYGIPCGVSNPGQWRSCDNTLLQRTVSFKLRLHPAHYARLMYQ